MSLLQNSNAISTGGGYNLESSLRFRSSASAYLSRTFGTPTNNKKWTISFWLKLSEVSAIRTPFGAAGSPSLIVEFDANRQFIFKVGGVNYYVSTPVYRDPSAWAHFIFVYDSDNATQADRTILYVNGTRQAATTASLPSGQATSFNANGVVGTLGAYIGNFWGDARDYFDGYMTEVNFVDGQALTPSDFGEYDDTTGVWKPKEYEGTYGTNGFYLPFDYNTTATYGGYVTDMASNFVNLPTGSQGSNFTFSGDFTIEGWVNYPTANGDGSLYVSSDGGTYLALNINMSGGVFNIYCNSGTPVGVISHGMVANQWNHVAMVRSGSTITLYTNGVAKGTITNSSTLGYSTLALNRFGGGASGARYLSNVRITKSAVYTSAFTPPNSPLTNIANTVCLIFQSSTLVDNSSNAYTLTQTGTTTLSIQYPFLTGSSVANDQSGQGNNWTTNNISLVNDPTYDLMNDVPTLTDEDTANFATLNPISNPNVPIYTVSNGNLTYSCSASTGNSGRMSITGTTLLGTGKTYWEVTPTNTNGGFGISYYKDIGIDVTAANPGSTSYVAAFNGNTIASNAGSPTYTGTTFSYAANDIIGIAYDGLVNSLAFYKNGTLIGTYTGISSGNWLPYMTPYTSTVATSFSINFGQRPFAYTPPTGYKKLNTYNLPDSTIVDGSQYFNTVTYTGNGSTQTITGIGFSPDLLWGKSRSASYFHNITDTVRGLTKYLDSSNSFYSSEFTKTDKVTAVTSDGFSLGADTSTDGSVNISGQSQVMWCWRASDSSPVSNTNGTITSTVSANTTSGFSVVTYTGTGATSATVGHGLGVSPKFIINKNRSATSSWIVQHDSLGWNSGFLGISTVASSSSTAFSNNTSPTSLVFTIGGYSNNSGQNYVAYCFADVEGFSKFGSYTGNGSSDGPFVYTGFRPAFVMTKRTDSSTNGFWNIYDNKRNGYNDNNDVLYPNSSSAEDNVVQIDLLSNGFKLRNTTYPNTSSGTYIYMAFAENPFKHSLAR